MATLLTEAQLAQGRDRIRRVTERQVVERGIERVSMHSIAQELGWSATALYRYFANKDDILAATRTAALDQLSDTLEAVMAGPGDIWARARAIGEAYVNFALERPDAYKLIFMRTSSSSPSPSRTSRSTRGWRPLRPGRAET